MRMKRMALVFADISGYTRFVTLRGLSLIHAEEIITELLEAVTLGADFPLRLNKFEGDAALMYAAVPDGREADVVADVARQVARFFDDFDHCQRDLMGRAEGGCPCDACTGIGDLRLKVFLHVGDCVVKHSAGFEELAGPDVILIHRLAKNSLDAAEYLMVTEAAAGSLVASPLALPDRHVECYPELGEVAVRVGYPGRVPPLAPVVPPMRRLSGLIEVLRLNWRALRRWVGRRQSSARYQVSDRV